MKARLGRFLLAHPRLASVLHGPVHRTEDRACFACIAVWQAVEGMPGFLIGLREAEGDFAAGHEWHHISATVSTPSAAPRVYVDGQVRS